MPAWSSEVANEFIRLGARDGRYYDQLQLQNLVYIAHGWQLAFDGEPLTGDRPEAWEFGPMYRRLANALVHAGMEPVTEQIPVQLIYPGVAIAALSGLINPVLTSDEQDTIQQTYEDYGDLKAIQLAGVTRTPDDAPWREVYARGTGTFKEISHRQIEAQFLRLVEK